MSTSWWCYRKSQGITGVRRIHPAGNIHFRIKFCVNSSDSFWSILFWTKVVDCLAVQPANIQRYTLVFWLKRKNSYRTLPSPSPSSSSSSNPDVALVTLDLPLWMIFFILCLWPHHTCLTGRPCSWSRPSSWWLVAVINLNVWNKLCLRCIYTVYTLLQEVVKYSTIVLVRKRQWTKEARKIVVHSTAW